VWTGELLTGADPHARYDRYVDDLADDAQLRTGQERQLGRRADLPDHTGRLTAGNHNVGLRDRLLTLATQPVDNQVPELYEVLVDGAEPCGGFVVVGVDLLLEGVESLTRLGLESGELFTEGVYGLTIRVGLHRPVLDAPTQGANSGQHRAVVGPLNLERRNPESEPRLV
jgi:hypothetical protein